MAWRAAKMNIMVCEDLAKLTSMSTMSIYVLNGGVEGSI